MLTMNKSWIQKIIAIIPVSAIISYLTNLFIPLSVLIFAIIIDYISGMTNAWVNNKLSSYRGFIGIVKKLCYFILVSVGVVIDILICNYFPEYTVSFISILITVWLIINELVSTIENLSSIGLPVPPYLIRIISHLQQSNEDKGDKRE